ncbi:MAG: TolC family protein [Gallionella sp.]|jgi:outer membrane protein TolC|nr:TolC family protein [Gallionella sp.]
MNVIVSRQLRLVVCCTVGVFASLSIYAAETPKSGLAKAVDQAWRLNPQAAGLEAREAEVRAAQEVAAGLTPKPGSISIGSLNDRLNRNRGQQEYEAELAVPLWLPGQKAAREAEAASRIDEAIAKRAALRLEVSGDLREAWWALAAARSAKTLAARRLETARALETDVVRRYKVGELSRIDANLAQTETHVANAELIEAEATLLQAEQAVQILTGSSAPKDLDEELPTTRRITGETGDSAESHPLLTTTAAAARSARARVQVADESRRAAPELALRVVRGRGDFAESYSNSVGIKLKIPFSSGSQVRRETSAAQAEGNQADADLQRTQTRVRLDAERAQRNLQSAERQLTMAQERRQLSAENLRLAEKAFSLGESDLATLLRIRAAAFDADAFFDRQRVARAAAISRLNQALGVLP